VSDPRRILNREILLIDDVYTTRTPASERARVETSVGGGSCPDIEGECFRFNLVGGKSSGRSVGGRVCEYRVNAVSRG
jgi:hypothetical protein